MPTDPTLIHTITTAAIPREGVCVCELCQPETAADRLIDSQSRQLTEMHATITSLRAELAKRDAAIAEWLKANDQWAAENDRLRTECFAQGQIADDLRVELAQANADVVAKHNAANKVIAKRDETIAKLEEDLYYKGLSVDGLLIAAAKAKAAGEEVLAWIEPPPWCDTTKDMIERFRSALATLAKPVPSEAHQ